MYITLQASLPTKKQVSTVKAGNRTVGGNCLANRGNFHQSLSQQSLIDSNLLRSAALIALRYVTAAARPTTGKKYSIF